MKVKDFNGNVSSWPLSGSFPTLDDSRPRSSLHLSVRKALRERYPTQRILEEVTIPGLNLYLDFYLPLEKLAVECQGKQHSEYVSHFHKDKAGFTKSQKRDSLKRQWCTLNNIRLEEVDYSENEEEIKKRISEF